jgi:hypothetical protein
MGTDAVSETLVNIYTLKRLSAREDFDVEFSVLYETVDSDVFQRVLVFGRISLIG